MDATRRRQFLLGAAALLAAPFSHAQRPARFADMHAHLMRRQGLKREVLAGNGVLLVAEKVIPDSPLLRLTQNRIAAFREARPGEMRRVFEEQFAWLRERVKAEALAEVSSAAVLEKVLKEGAPAIALSSEGADFLEGDLGYLEKVRGEGLVCLQLVHYRISEVGDIATEEPKHGGLTAFGKDVVRACNQLGILIDVAHCTSAGIEQALELSAKPVVYSHGHVSAAAPRAAQGGIAARAIHMPLAKRIAERGGVVGLWPLWSQFANLNLYCDALARMAEALGAQHVGIGTDMFGLPRSVIPSYAEFAELPGYLAKRGLREGEVEAVLGGNYLRLLRTALAS